MKAPRTMGMVLICVMSACLYAAAQSDMKQSQPKSKSKQATSASNTEGEKRFRTNCGRCHNPPEDLSPREARAVLRQMRVRAMLSSEDERLILQYVAP
jgi:mono/diheme cytochrome c family protein